MRRPSIARCFASLALLTAGVGTPSAGAAPAAPTSKASSLAELRFSADGATLVGISDRGKKRAAFRAYDGASGLPTWSLELQRLRDPKRRERLEFEEWQPSAVPGELLLESRGDLFLVQVAGPSVRRLTATAAVETDAKLSPDGSRVAYVRQGDLWALELITGKETRLTDDGRPPALVNGVRPQPEREIFAGGAGFAWAAESRTIAFLRQNGGAIELAVVTVLAPAPQIMEIGGPGEGELTEVHWRFDARALAVERRAATGERYDLLLCHPEKRYCRPLAHRDTDRESSPRRDFWFLANGFLWSTSLAKHDSLARFDTVGRERQSIPLGEWRVERIESEDELAGVLLLVSATRTTPTGASERALLRLPSSFGAPQLLASGATLELLVSPAGATVVVTEASAGAAAVRELRTTDGKTVATLPPPK